MASMDPLLIDETLHTIVTLVVYFSGTRFRKSDPVPTTGTRFQSQIRVHSRNRVQQWPPRRLQSLFAPPLDSRLCRHRGSRCRARHHSTSRRRRRIHRSVANTASAVCCPTVDAAAVLPAIVLTAVSPPSLPLPRASLTHCLSLYPLNSGNWLTLQESLH